MFLEFENWILMQYSASYNNEVVVQIIKVMPSFFLLALICATLFMFYEEIRALFGKLKGVEVGDVKLSFDIEMAIDAAVRLAEKDRKWPDVVVPEKDKEQAAKRAGREKKIMEDAHFLWVDDRPENNNNERKMFHELGVFVDFAKNTEDALEMLKNRTYDCIISDMDRDGDFEAGTKMLLELKKRCCDLKVIIYLGQFEEDRGIPRGAFGITDRPDELLHLSLDIMARRR